MILKDVTHTPTTCGVSRRRINAVHAGFIGFPFAPLAVINKHICLAKGLAEADVRVRVINRSGFYDPDGPYRDAAHGTFEGVEYVTASGVGYRPKRFLRRNLLKLKGFVAEAWYLVKARRAGELDAMIIETPLLTHMVFYRLLTKLLGVSLIYHYTEMWSAVLRPDHGRLRRLSLRTVDRVTHHFFDAVIPISDVLADHVRRMDPKMPMLQVPILCDFDKFDGPRRADAPPYFLYCGSADYAEVIYFLLDAFSDVASEPDIDLHLVVHGPDHKRARIREHAARHPAAARVKFFHNLPYEELVDQYNHATALLIPLRPTVQDAARFPHKIAEYLASRNPVVTTAYGEIRKYFVDLDTALVASAYDRAQFAEKMQWVVDNPEEARRIGERGHWLGHAHFHYATVGHALRQFIERIRPRDGVAAARPRRAVPVADME